MKKLAKILLLLFLIILYAYVCNITLLPDSYIIKQGETLNIYTLIGLSIQGKKDTLQAVSTINQSYEPGKVDLSLKLFDLL